MNGEYQFGVIVPFQAGGPFALLYVVAYGDVGKAVTAWFGDDLAHFVHGDHVNDWFTEKLKEVNALHDAIAHLGPAVPQAEVAGVAEHIVGIKLVAHEEVGGFAEETAVFIHP